MPDISRYSAIKRLMIKYPKLREVGASVFLAVPLPLSKVVYRTMRRYVFKDNMNRLNTFHAAFTAISKRTKSISYLEFGVARGTSTISAYDIATSYGLDCNLYAFDSFQGLPGDEGGVFAKGDYSYTQQCFRNFVAKAGVPKKAVHVIPGFYEQSLTPELYAQLGFKKGIYCVHIDSDLYESAKTVLTWLAPVLDSGSVIVFDDWFAFDHMPNPQNYGEQRAFSEWSERANWTQLHIQNEWNIAFVRS